MKDTLVKLKDFSASVRTGIPGSEAFHTREEKISLCYHHNEMRRKEEKQLCTGLTCVWRHQVKSTQQRLKTLLKQVSELIISKHKLYAVPPGGCSYQIKALADSVITA